MTITREWAKEVVLDAYRDRNGVKDETDFCRQFTYGYWATNNSVFALLKHIERGPRGLAFLSLDQIADYLCTQDTVMAARNLVEYYLKTYDDIKSQDRVIF